jgi:hypothetical protein
MILALERDLRSTRAQLDALRAALAQAELDLRDAVQDVHRSYRRDLVPVPRAVVSVRHR